MNVQKQQIIPRIISSIRHRRPFKIIHEVCPLPDSNTYFCWKCQQEFTPITPNINQEMKA